FIRQRQCAKCPDVRVHAIDLNPVARENLRPLSRTQSLCQRLRRARLLLVGDVPDERNVAKHALPLTQEFLFFPAAVSLSSDRQDWCVFADLFRTGIEQEPALLDPGVRSPWLRAHADHPRWKHIVARHESHECQRMKQATVARRERMRTQSPENVDQLDGAPL